MKALSRDLLWNFFSVSVFFEELAPPFLNEPFDEVLLSSSITEPFNER